MNKKELVDAVAAAAVMPKVDAAKAVDALFNVVTTVLREGDEVRVVGFGTFAVSERAARSGKNPRTGAVIEIPASKQPKFKAGQALKDAVASS